MGDIWFGTVSTKNDEEDELLCFDGVAADAESEDGSNLTLTSPPPPPPTGGVATPDIHDSASPRLWKPKNGSIFVSRAKCCMRVMGGNLCKEPSDEASRPLALVLLARIHKLQYCDPF